MFTQTHTHVAQKNSAFQKVREIVSQLTALGQSKAPNENTVNMDPGPSSDALQKPKTTPVRGKESAEEKDWFTFEPTPERSPLPNQVPEANSTAPPSRKVPARKWGTRRHNLLLDKLHRKKTRRQMREWKKLFLLQKFSKELRITKSALETCQEEKQALRHAEAHAHAQAGKFEKALDNEKHMHVQTKSELSTARQEASAFRQTAGEFEKALENETQMHTGTKSELCAAKQEASTLLQSQLQADHNQKMMRRMIEDKQDMLDDAVEERNKAERTATTARQGQLKAISELNKAMRLNQGSDQSTDTQLIQKLVELRNNIRTWSLTYSMTQSKNAPRLYRQDIKTLDQNGLDSVMHRNFFERSLQEPTLRPTVVRSVLWGVLQNDIFRQYLWVMRPFASSVRETHRFLASKMMNNRSQDSNEESYKFNIWRANGSAMFSRAPKPGQKRNTRKHIITQLVTSTILLLKPLLASQDQEDAEYELYQIIDQALALDEELCQQVADLSLEYLGGSSSLVGAHFSPRTMTTEIGSKDATAEDVVSVVLAPALFKRGNSAGNDFDKRIILVRMEVICQPAEPSPSSSASSITSPSLSPVPAPKPSSGPRDSFQGERGMDLSEGESRGGHEEDIWCPSLAP